MGPLSTGFGLAIFFTKFALNSFELFLEKILALAFIHRFANSAVYLVA